MDNDTPLALKRRVKYILSSGVDAYMCTILTPLPGTKLFDKLKEEDRLLPMEYPAGWMNYEFTNAVFRPGKMSPEELNSEMAKNWEKLYNLWTIRWKALKTLINQRNLNLRAWFTKGVQATGWAFYTNWHYNQYMKSKVKLTGNTKIH